MTRRRALSLPSRTPSDDRVIFRQSGGFAGLRRACEVPLAALPPSARAALAAVRRTTPADTAAARDVITYRLTVRRGGRETTHDFDDRTRSPRLQTLIRYFAARARPAEVGDA